MKKNKLLMTAVIFGVGAFVSTILISPNIIKQGNAEPTMYTITLSDSKNKITENNIDGVLFFETNLGNSVEFGFYAANYLEGGWATFDSELNGVYTEDPVHGIQSISITLKEHSNSFVDIFYGVDKQVDLDQRLTFTDSVCNITFDTEVNYFDLSSTGTIHIQEIVITYTC